MASNLSSGSAAALTFRSLVWGYLACCGLLIAGCQETTVPAETVISISGRVVDSETAAPIPDALVTLNPSLASALSDSNGEFSLDNISLSVESYTLNVTVDGYRRYVQSIATAGLEDDVSLIVSLETAQVSERAPTRPFDPSPENGSVNQMRNLTLRWRSDDDNPDALRFDVYLADEFGVQQIATALRDTFYDLDGLRFGESYTWQVAAYDDSRDTIFGPIWTFSTLPQPSYPLAFSKIEDGNPAIFSADNNVPEENFFRISAPGIRAFRPKYSPSGDNIAYLQYFGTDIYLMVSGADGTNAKRAYPLPLLNIFTDLYDFDWTSDGFNLVFGYGNQLISVDVATGRATALLQVPSDRRVSEVSAHPDAGRYALNVVSLDGVVTDILEVRTNTGVIDTLIPDTTGLISGIEYSPSGNQLLASIDVSGRESTSLRQFDARLFEFDLVTGLRRLVSNNKPQGFNDLMGSYSADGGFIYFNRVQNTIGELPDIFRVERLQSSTTPAILVLQDASDPTLR